MSQTDKNTLQKSFSEKFNNFRQDMSDNPDKAKAFKELVDVGQDPNVMVISCSDSRLVINQLFQADPGDVFISRHVANLVIPYDSEKTAENPLAGAVEYAVDVLNVKDIIIKGHTGCGGIGALVNAVDAMQREKPENYRFSDVEKWVLNAKDVILENQGMKLDPDFVEQMGRHVLVWSLENLKEYPSVRKGLEDGTLGIHAWQFDMHNLQIIAYDEDSNSFKSLTDDNVPHSPDIQISSDQDHMSSEP